MYFSKSLIKHWQAKMKTSIAAGISKARQKKDTFVGVEFTVLKLIQ